jgi:hypothetical protein
MGRKQNYPIDLSETERVELEAIVKTGQHRARVRRRAQTLLWSDAARATLRLPTYTGLSP